MYIIGINFCHRVATASCINTNDSVRKLMRLNILDGNTDESKKVESAVCRDAETGEWRFVKDFMDGSNPGYTDHFNTPINESSDDKKEAFAAFIKLVYEHILSNNDFLSREQYCIYAACPFLWSDYQIFKYKEFLSKCLPIEWVIKESDAAYFKFKAERNFDISDSALVIDIGSSTIGFTAYGNKGIESLFDGKRHGASRVECDICKYFRDNDSDFKEAEEEAKIFCQNKGTNWLNAVLHYVKTQKEDFYTKELGAFYLDLSNKVMDPTLKKRVFDASEIDRKLLEDTILKNYKAILKHDMEHVKGKIGNPNVVILTGGASRMPWLQSLVNDVFSDSEFYRDDEPSYVVSDGIAWYGLKSFESKPCIEQTFNNLLINNDARIVNEVWAKIYNHQRCF